MCSTLYQSITKADIKKWNENNKSHKTFYSRLIRGTEAMDIYKKLEVYELKDQPQNLSTNIGGAKGSNISFFYPLSKVLDINAKWTILVVG